MKQFKNGKIVEGSATTKERLQRHAEKAGMTKKAYQPISIRDLEKRIAALEEAVATLTAKEETVEVVESAEPAETLTE